LSGSFTKTTQHSLHSDHCSLDIILLVFVACKHCWSSEQRHLWLWGGELQCWL